jgi:hypothetical protein
VDVRLKPAELGGAVDYLTFYVGPAWSELDSGALKLVEIHWE